MCSEEEEQFLVRAVLVLCLVAYLVACVVPTLLILVDPVWVTIYEDWVSWIVRKAIHGDWVSWIVMCVFKAPILIINFIVQKIENSTLMF